jgi:hypothetical protein
MTEMQWMEMLVSIIVALVANSGFWVYIQHRRDRYDAKTKIMVGMAHDMIIERANHYMKRGDWITDDEYTYLVEYLFEPYKELGGNGAAEKAINDMKSKVTVVHCPPEVDKNA